MRLTARVPATSANLGPGFDCFGLALDLCNEVTIDTDAEPGVTWEGEGADELPADGSDLVSRGLRDIALQYEGPSTRLRLHGVNRIPLGRGLGSSAAAALAGLALGYKVFADVDPDPYLLWSEALELEGHPDNVAAAAYGGFTIAIVGVGVRRLDPHPTLNPAILIPLELRTDTAESRRALPSEVSREDAVFNVQRTALAMVALTEEPTLLRAALKDRLHQDARLALVPSVRDVFDRLETANVPVCLSGSGPTLLAFETDERRVPDLGEGWRVLRVPVRATGVEVFES
jgi:homoserine kinase